MKKIRVLVVDDSAVIRRLISDLFAKDSAIEVAGTASNGHTALEKIAQLNPDLVMLDVEMPEMDGLETVTAIRAKWPHLPVIMFSSLTEHGAEPRSRLCAWAPATTSPSPSTPAAHKEFSSSCARNSSPKSRRFAPRRTKSRYRPRPCPQHQRRSPFGPSRCNARLPRVRIVAIGVSTGGPNALHSLIPNLPGNFPVPVVIVQHMPAVFTRLLAEQLAKRSALDVHEGASGAVIKPGQVWIAPGGPSHAGPAQFEFRADRQPTKARPKILAARPWTFSSARWPIVSAATRSQWS